jgi:hypothetical protein
MVPSTGRRRDIQAEISGRGHVRAQGVGRAMGKWVDTDLGCGLVEESQDPAILDSYRYLMGYIACLESRSLPQLLQTRLPYISVISRTYHSIIASLCFLLNNRTVLISH